MRRAKQGLQEAQAQNRALEEQAKISVDKLQKLEQTNQKLKSDAMTANLQLKVVQQQQKSKIKYATIQLIQTISFIHILSLCVFTRDSELRQQAALRKKDSEIQQLKLEINNLQKTQLQRKSSISNENEIICKHDNSANHQRPPSMDTAKLKTQNYYQRPQSNKEKIKTQNDLFSLINQSPEQSSLNSNQMVTFTEGEQPSNVDTSERQFETPKTNTEPTIKQFIATNIAEQIPITSSSDAVNKMRNRKHGLYNMGQLEEEMAQGYNRTSKNATIDVQQDESDSTRFQEVIEHETNDDTQVTQRLSNPQLCNIFTKTIISEHKLEFNIRSEQHDLDSARLPLYIDEYHTVQQEEDNKYQEDNHKNDKIDKFPFLDNENDYFESPMTFPHRLSKD
eukprot:TRINITY_DN74726_c0_g1_i1.p1 TRINITY_DN74726_c0_g1~~TRINITY_DN74726_c0_g1_i1.p1  ORF type:complete len:394 (-),score=26.50 TRINITY_DN74726_c0_g1_i1:496-1677(-)